MPVPTVVAARAKRAQIARVICSALTTFNHMVDDQATAGTAVWRAAVTRGAAIAIPLENRGPHPLPRLRAVVGIVCLRPLVRGGCPARGVGTSVVELA